jgi:hypothetical protein
MGARGTSKTDRVQTTVRLPRPIYENAKSLLDGNVRDVRTFNELVITALRAFIRLTKRKQIDQAFAAMAEDAHYQKEARVIAADFEESDWEALELADKEEVRTD